MRVEAFLMSLDFEHADTGQESAGIQCGVCRKPILDQYYQVNQGAMCDSCVKGHFAESPGLKGYLRAWGFGAVAAFLGALLDLVITSVTGYQLGLIALVMGWMVGFAVNVGSRGRGGRWFQFMALVLTYLAISASFTGQVLKYAAQQGGVDPVAISTPGAELTPAAPQPVATPVAAETPTAVEPTGETPTAETAPAEAPTQPVVETPTPTAGEMIVSLGFLMGMCLALPVLVGFESPISLLINAFALWEAWRMTKRVEVEGPFLVGSGEVGKDSSQEEENRSETQ